MPDVDNFLTSCAGMTCHARREYLAQNWYIFLVSSILKYNPAKTNDKFNIILLYYYTIIILLYYIILSSDVPMNSKRQVIVYGLVTRYSPRISCQHKMLKDVKRS